MRIGRLRYDLERQASVLTIPLGGPFSMTYRSNLTPGFTAGLSSRLVLVRDEIPDGLTKVSVTTSLDNHDEETEYEPKPHVSHLLEATEPTRVSVSARYHFADGVAPMRSSVSLGAPDAAAQGLGGFVLEGQPMVDGSTLNTARGRTVSLTLDGSNALVGTHRGLTYVVEGGVVVRAVDAITGRTVWESTVEGERGRLIGPHGATLEVERSGDEVRLEFGETRTIVTTSPFASKIVAESVQATLEMSPSGLLLSIDDGQRTELQYTDEGRLSEFTAEHNAVVFRREEHENGFTVGATDGADIDESIEVRTTAAGIARTRRCCGQPPTRTITGTDRVTIERSDGSVVERVRNGGATDTTVTLPSGATRTWRRTVARVGDLVESKLEHAGEAWVTRMDVGTGAVEMRSPGGRIARSHYEDGRQTRQASLDGTWQEFDWGDGVIDIAGTYGESTTHFEGSTTRIEYPFGTVEYEEEPDGVRWTDANGVTMTERGSEHGAVVEIDGNAYLETSHDDSRRVVAHGADTLATSEGGEVTLEGALQSTDDGASSTVRGHGIDRTIEYAGRRVAAVRTPQQSTTVRWDGGELKSFDHAGVVTGSVGYGHDEAGRIRSLDILGESYDIAMVDGHMTQLGDLSIELDQDAIRPRRASIGSLTETYEYDDAGRLTEMVVEFAGREVFGDRRSYDDASRISTRRLGESKHRYEYDRDRLAGVRGTDHRFSYDGLGRLVGISGTTIEVSPVGAPTVIDGAAVTMTRGRRIASVGGTHFGYNAAGELTKIDADGSTISIERDGMGRPIEIDRNGGIRRIVWGTAGPAALLDREGAVLERYLGTPGSRVPALVVRAGTTYRLITDRNGSPLALIDVDSGEVDTWEWSPYGTRLRGPDFLFGFSGGIDLGDGVTDLGARSYAASIGRWLQWDPVLHYGGGTDLYGYAANDPVNRYDPSGTYAEYCVGKSQFGAWPWLDYIPHAWLKFDGKARGQAPGRWSEFLTEWNEDNPDREDLFCIPAPLVDEDCIDRLTEPGSSAGLYPVAPTLRAPHLKVNICFTVAMEVLLECLAVGIVTSELEGLKDLFAKMNPGLEECCGDNPADPQPPEVGQGAGAGAAGGQQPIDPGLHEAMWVPW